MTLWRRLMKLFGISANSLVVSTESDNATQGSIESDFTPPRKSGGASAATVLPFGASVTQRPLVNSQLQVAGFEFRLNEKIVARLQSSRNNPARISYYLGLLTAARLNTQRGRLSLVGLPADLLEHDFIADSIEPGLWLIIGAVQQPNDIACSVMNRLREQRVRVGWQAHSLGQFTNIDLPVDFVVFMYGSGDVAGLKKSHELYRKRYPNLIGIATDLPNIDEIETAIQSRFELASGAFVAHPADQHYKRPLTPATERLCLLLSLIMNGGDHGEIVEQLKADVKTSYQLLCHINSASVGLKYPVDNLDDALYLLGRDRLYQWLTVMLVHSGSARPASRALQEVSLGRARFLEGLAQTTGAAPPELLFSLGIFSLLHLLLNTSVDTALQPLKLSPDLSAALHGSGPWAIYLQLVVAWERNDSDLVFKVAEQVGLTYEKIAHLAANSIVWARQAMEFANYSPGNKVLIKPHI